MTADTWAEHRDELLAAAVEQRLRPTRDGGSVFDGRDATAEAAHMVAAGLLAKAPGRLLYEPTTAGRAAYTGPDRCPHCDAWPQVEWLGERGARHAYRCATGHRWEVPA